MHQCFGVSAMCMLSFLVILCIAFSDVYQKKFNHNGTMHSIHFNTNTSKHFPESFSNYILHQNYASKNNEIHFFEDMGFLKSNM